MRTVSKILGAVALAAMLGFSGGCSSEDMCDACDANDPINPLERLPGDAPSDAPPCEVVCAVLDECGVSDEGSCMFACPKGAFTNDERECFARASCGDEMAICLETHRSNADEGDRL